MFVGHYSVAFAVKSERNQVPLWVLFVAVQLLDFLWAAFVLLGVEKMRMVPGITATNALDLYYMPYTHSLAGALAWSGLAALVYRFASRAKAVRAAAWIVALAVFSHWILDLVVHRPDLALYDDTWKIGLGLWNYRGLEFGLEVAMLAGGILLYLKRNNSIARKAGMIAFGLVLILVQAGNTFIHRAPPSDRAFAIMALVFYTLFAGVAFLLERGRKLSSEFSGR